MSATEGPKWSFSRSKLYASCPKALYFAETEGPTGHIETQFASLAEVVGISVHEAISKEIQKLNPGTGFNVTRAARDAAELVASMSASMRPEALRYRREVGPNAIRASQTAAWKLLMSFGRFVWPRYQGHTVISRETTSRFEIAGVSVSVKPDLVTRTPDGNIVVTDWKTYADTKPEEELLQLSAYIVWAWQKFRTPIDSIEGWIATLPNGEIREIRGSPAMADEITARIASDVSRWTVIAPEYFPPHPGPEKCSVCPFLALCPEGREVTALMTAKTSGDNE